eukprot:12397319-Alexandrium_andersonii.AAC.1
MLGALCRAAARVRSPDARCHRGAWGPPPRLHSRRSTCSARVRPERLMQPPVMQSSEETDAN